MKKRILILLITAATILTCSCSPKKETCSDDGCSQEVYKDGLCADHYVSSALSEATNPTEQDNSSIDPAIAELQSQYQEYIDDAISTLRNSLKNPKSLDIYNIYLSDESVGPYYNRNIEICIDATAENGFVVLLDLVFIIRTMTLGKSFANVIQIRSKAYLTASWNSALVNVFPTK